MSIKSDFIYMRHLIKSTKTKWNGTCQELKGGGSEGLLFNEQSQFCKIITVLEMSCITMWVCLTLSTVHLKMVKMVNFKLCILYLKLKKKNLR